MASARIRQIVFLSQIFNVILFIAVGMSRVAFLLSQQLHRLKVMYRDNHSMTQWIVMGILVFILLRSLVSLGMFPNSKTNMPSAMISSVVHNWSLRHRDNITRLRGRIRIAFYSRGVSNDPVREPPAWRLNYEIGSGACGTVFLENVQTRDMGSPELWAVKMIPRALPNFTFKRYQAEIKNLEALAKVSLSRTRTIS